MKFGAFWNDKAYFPRVLENIGNEIQHFYSIIQLLLDIGVSKEDIVDIKNSERSSSQKHYERTIFPVNEAMFHLGDDSMYSRIFPFARNIEPVFIAISLVGRSELYPEAIEYLHRFEPIGARDEWTMSFLHKNGIESYLFGCISLTLPTRLPCKSQDRVFFVDEPSEINDCAPDYHKTKMIKLSHIFPDEINNQTNPLQRYRLAESVINNYRDNASLVITSKLHSAVPCVAMGIPVVLATENHSDRFSWIDKHLHIYTPSEWHSINWNPEPIEVSEIKNLMRRSAKNKILSSIMNMPSDVALQKEISKYWLERPRFTYNNFASEVLQNELKGFPKDMKYVIWGCGLVGEQVFSVMEKLYPEAKFVGAVDSFANGVFHSYIIQKPEYLLDLPNCVVLAATYTGRDAVDTFMSRHKRVYGKDYIRISTTSG